MHPLKYKLLVCALFAWASASGTATATEKIVLYGDEDYAPYSYVEAGHFKGMYVEILSEAAKMLASDYSVELQPIPWKRGLAELASGRSFALFPPGFKKERDYIQPYSIPIYRETVVLFCNDKTLKTPRENFPDDFSGLTIGINAGFLLSGRLIEAANRGVVKLEPAKGNEANIEKLALNRIDCYASDRAAARFSVKRLPGYFSTVNFQLREAVELSGEDTFIGFSVNNNPPYKADFISKMNAVLEHMKNNGDIARIEKNYLQ
jgi:polar amino acid transport system substrate-binding protein